MFSQSYPAAATAILLVFVITTITADASDWKASVNPASSITQAAFQEPVTGPDFEPEEDPFAPPLLPPIPDDEATEAEPDDAKVDEEPAETAGADDVPDFEPEPPSPTETSDTSGKNGDKVESDETPADEPHSDTGKTKLKVSEAEEEADKLFNPKEWLGR